MSGPKMEEEGDRKLGRRGRSRSCGSFVVFSFYLFPLADDE